MKAEDLIVGNIYSYKYRDIGPESIVDVYFLGNLNAMLKTKGFEAEYLFSTNKVGSIIQLATHELERIKETYGFLWVIYEKNATLLHSDIALERATKLCLVEEHGFTSELQARNALERLKNGSSSKYKYINSTLDVKKIKCIPVEE